MKTKPFRNTTVLVADNNAYEYIEVMLYLEALEIKRAFNLNANISHLRRITKRNTRMQLHNAYRCLGQAEASWIG